MEARRLLALLLAAAMFSVTGQCSEEQRPNIVLILADDFGWGDVSCNNAEAVFSTPNIDRIAAEGIRFSNAFTPHSVCTPTRYALLTGRYAWRTWMREGVLPGYDKALIPPERLTLASLLKKHGYATGAFGKWHVGMDWQPIKGDPGDWHQGTQTRARGVVAAIGQRVDHTKPVLGGPTALGFDTFFGCPSNNTRIPVFMRDDRIDGTAAPDATGLMRDERVQRDSVDEFFLKEATAFVDAHQRKRDGRPFFVYLPLNAAHGATRAPEELQGKSGDGSRGDKCLWVDRSVGRMLEVLDERGLTENTLVIFTADNGPIAPRRYMEDTRHKAAGPYRGYKTDAWDGGCRVPFAARWPGHIREGSTQNGLLCLTDMIATIAALLGDELPQWAGEDSLNQLPALLGGNPDVPIRDQMITQSYVGVLSVRKGPWKLILDTKGSGGHKDATPGFEPLVQGPPWELDMSQVGQLYNIEKDPYEQNDLYDKHPQVVTGLTTWLIQQVKNGRSRP